MYPSELPVIFLIARLNFPTKTSDFLMYLINSLVGILLSNGNTNVICGAI
ncbi:MAG: hypothetical protein ACI8WT_001936 [Clostridium sp.]|jgi:hypothetical protein